MQQIPKPFFPVFHLHHLQLGSYEVDVRRDDVDIFKRRLVHCLLRGAFPNQALINCIDGFFNVDTQSG